MRLRVLYVSKYWSCKVLSSFVSASYPVKNYRTMYKCNKNHASKQRVRIIQISINSMHQKCSYI